MDGNKDDAIKCIGIAKAALSSGDEVRAKKFIEKAKRLDPGLDVTELLSSCLDMPKQQSESQESQSSANPNPKNPSPEKVPNGIGGVGVSGARPGYTAEQVEIVRKVRRNNKDYYAVLGLEKSCSIEDVRKAYRKLSLKVHPDKNKAPGSEEAFKSVSKAFQCLSNEETRRQYDVSGPDEDFEVAQQQRSQFRRRRTATGFHDDFFDADEIFRSFFYGTSDAHNIFQRAHVMRTRTANAANRGGAQESGGFNMASLLQILPVLLLFLISFLPSSEPQYSLQKAYPYQFRQVTEKYGVPYYVRSVDFGQDYKPGSPERSEFERPVIRDYVNLLGRYCHMEMSHRRFNRNAETPHCDQLKKFEAVR